MALSKVANYGMGRAAPDASGRLFFCKFTSVQRNPDTGSMLFLHRGGLKFYASHMYLSQDPVPMGWTHVCISGQHVPMRSAAKEAPTGVIPNGIPAGCHTPVGNEAIIKTVDPEVASLSLFYCRLYIHVRFVVNRLHNWSYNASSTCGIFHEYRFTQQCQGIVPAISSIFAIMRKHALNID
jgi:hypothetical protein